MVLDRKMIVLACNTAQVVWEEAKEKLDAPALEWFALASAAINRLIHQKLGSQIDDGFFWNL